jgi:hypothetical protein
VVTAHRLVGCLVLSSAAAVRHETVILGSLVVVVAVVRVPYARCGVFASNCVYAGSVAAPGAVVLVAAADAVHLRWSVKLMHSPELRVRERQLLAFGSWRRYLRNERVARPASRIRSFICANILLQFFLGTVSNTIKANNVSR